ncbi:hypothetical protein BGZ65_003602 [Modicella reniformis]|uniref:MEIOB-like N-terminal domain-containing protein n=1 Tax=Modicella reniformis TaxID=1440133 RepID=A0A9P6IP04_9FUNG|nr:hypothetical protein BGZ65_003602 [Modicella reniformis]
MVPIQSLQPMKSFVVSIDAHVVHRRTVRPSDVKAFPDKKDPNKQRWLQSFIIKDDHDTIEVKFWHKTQEHLNMYTFISLDQVVHVWSDDIKLNTWSSTSAQTAHPPSTSSSFCLNLSEGRIGHKIDLGNEVEMATLFKTALGANIGGVVPSISIKQAIGALNSIGHQRFNMIVCTKQVPVERIHQEHQLRLYPDLIQFIVWLQLLSPTIVNSKNGPLKKSLLTVFDAQGQEASLTLWGEAMATAAEKWIPLSTTLLLTGAQVTIYALKPQLTVGFQTHIQVDPACKNVEWLKHFAAQCSALPNEQSLIEATDNVAIEQIRACHQIADISSIAQSLGTLELVYGKTIAILSEFDIENLASDVLTAKCPSCKGTITSYKMEVCPRCQVMPKSDDSWTYCFSRHISFMDNTAELYHPSISSDIVQNLLEFKPKEFSALSLLERMQLKV